MRNIYLNDKFKVNVVLLKETPESKNSTQVMKVEMVGLSSLRMYFETGTRDRKIYTKNPCTSWNN